MNFSLNFSTNKTTLISIFAIVGSSAFVWAGDTLGKNPYVKNQRETDSVAGACNCAPCPSGLAPIGVMGDHTHRAGGMMFSYRAMLMSMGGHQSGTDSLSSHEVHGVGFDVAATSMDMEMHMLGAMWAPTDRLTLMVMGNYRNNDMALVSAASADEGMHMAHEAKSTATATSHGTTTHVAPLTDLPDLPSGINLRAGAMLRSLPYILCLMPMRRCKPTSTLGLLCPRDRRMKCSMEASSLTGCSWDPAPTI